MTVRSSPPTAPFAEPTEQLGGHYLVDAPDLDAASAIAAGVPAAADGTLEVRPVMHIEGGPSA